jgi:hypothetical protein
MPHGAHHDCLLSVDNILVLWLQKVSGSPVRKCELLLPRELTCLAVPTDQYTSLLKQEEIEKRGSNLRNRLHELR